MAIVAETKDWTWVLERPCAECGYEPSALEATAVGEEVLASVPRWRAALARPDARERPDDATWSVLEYACHVRDVLVLFAQRSRSMREQDDPEFANWDQDATAVEDRYDQQDPAVVADEIDRAAHAYAAELAAVTDWQRTGRRSNGSVFTADTLTRYAWHDLAHHLHDVDA